MSTVVHVSGFLPQGQIERMQEALSACEGNVLPAELHEAISELLEQLAMWQEPA